MPAAGASVFAYFFRAVKNDALAKHWMAKQKFRPARLGGFSGAKAYIG